MNKKFLTEYMSDNFASNVCWNALIFYEKSECGAIFLILFLLKKIFENLLFVLSNYSKWMKMINKL